MSLKEAFKRYHVQVATRLHLQQAIKLRTQVFVGAQKIPLNEEANKQDATATHLVLLDSQRPPTNQLIGNLRVIDVPTGRFVKLSRFVISPQYQGLGLGKLLLAAAEMHILKNPKFSGYHYIRLGSLLDKQGFYKKFGYQQEGNVYNDEGAPLIMMKKCIG